MTTSFASHTYAFILASLLYLGGQLVHAEHVHSDVGGDVAVLDCALCSVESVLAVSSHSAARDRLQHSYLYSMGKPDSGLYRNDVCANGTRAPPLA